MDAPITAALLSPADRDWPDRVAAIRSLLGAPHDPTVFPSHFLRVVLPRIGGHVVQFQTGQHTAGVGFLLPRALAAGQHVYTLRGHSLHPAIPVHELAVSAQSALPGTQIIPYDPAAEHVFHPSHATVDGRDIGAPCAAEAGAIRDLQAQLWGSDADNLYPTDIHCAEFGSVQSQVVRSDDRVVAFLFGFYKFGGRPLPQEWQGQVNGAWRLESQVLGVHPDLRGRGVATLLKARQAELARQAGIDLINWTADPLLWPNAVLNFGRLGALAFDFTPNMYPFRNEMNRVPASRLALTWLVNSRRVREHLRAPGNVPDLAETGAVVVNVGSTRADLAVDGPLIAVEIPPDWVRLQAESLEQALAWRQATDAVLSHYIGSEPGRYAVTGVAREGEHRFLLAERVTEVWLRAMAR